jgi:hypothetical protein
VTDGLTGYFPEYETRLRMNIILGVIGSACVTMALGQLVPEGMWIWLGLLVYGCCTLTIAMVWEL